MLHVARRRGAVLNLHGEYDLSRGEEIDTSIAGAISGRVSRLAVDLGDVTFLDCYSISLLLRGQRLAAAHGTRMYVVNATNPLVQRVLDLTGAATVLQPPAHADKPVAAPPHGPRPAAA